MIVKRQPRIALEVGDKIPLTDNSFALVDQDDYERLSQHRWKKVKSGHCYYAVRKVQRDGKVYYEKMHRIIAKTPIGMDCHHKNHNTLDNRKSNLKNLDKTTHHSVHAMGL